MDYSLCMVADFQNGLISLIFGAFSSGFLHILEYIFACFLEF